MIRTFRLLILCSAAIAEVGSSSGCVVIANGSADGDRPPGGGRPPDAGRPPDDGGGPIGDGGFGGGDVAMRWLAFDSDRATFNRDIYLVRGDGSQLLRLTTDTSAERDPAFSPDGARLAFASDRSGSMQIHVMELVHRRVTQLTFFAAGADEPSWSRDGARIAFHSGNSVYMMSADGSNARPMATGPDSFNAYRYPSFSLDGRELLFSRSNEVDALKFGEPKPRYVVQNWTTTEETPALSADGKLVAFGVVCGSVEVIAMTSFADYAPDPCKTQRVTLPTAGTARRPSWAGNDAIAFERLALPENAAVISITQAPGSAPRDIVGPPGNHRDPSWAPVGFEPVVFGD